LVINAQNALRLFGIRVDQAETLSQGCVPSQRPALPRQTPSAGGVLDLEHITAEDIMVPRSGSRLGLDQDRGSARAADRAALGYVRGTLDNLVGILHVRKLLQLLSGTEAINVATLRRMLDEPYFIPNGTDLNTQLLNFQRYRERLAMVVDEYGVRIADRF
jgi:Mg2+/Co2+ transporter CorB